MELPPEFEAPDPCPSVKSVVETVLTRQFDERPSATAVQNTKSLRKVLECGRVSCRFSPFPLFRSPF